MDATVYIFFYTEEANSYLLSSSLKYNLHPEMFDKL